MIIHKCDRCGTEIVPRKKTLSELLNMELFGEEKSSLRISDCSKSFPTYIDLCEACQKSFDEWFINKRGEKNEG